MNHLKLTTATAVLFFSCLSVVGQTNDLAELEVIRCDVQMEPPGWALRERHLIDVLYSAKVGHRFVNFYHYY